MLGARVIDVRATNAKQTHPRPCALTVTSNDCGWAVTSTANAAAGATTKTTLPNDRTPIVSEPSEVVGEFRRVALEFVARGGEFETPTRAREGNRTAMGLAPHDGTEPVTASMRK